LIEDLDIIWHAIKNRSLMSSYAQLLGYKMGTNGLAKGMLGKSSDGQFPIPIFTACFPDANDVLQWEEFTPYEIGSTFLRTFFNMDYLQLDGAEGTPPSLAELMAVWGSAYNAPFVMILQQMGVNVPPWFADILGTASLKGSGIVNPNYNRTDPVTGELMPLANYKKIYLRDGGIKANLPVPALLLRPERTVDLIIALDASGDVRELPFDALKKAIPSLVVPTTYQFPYVFPKTDDHPQIIYIPVMQNDTFEPGFDPEKCGTLKFDYDQKTTLSLENLAYSWTKLANTQIRDFIGVGAQEEPNV